MLKIKEAVMQLECAVPLKPADVTANRAYRKAVHEARTALEATDEAALRESQWEALGDILAGCVPDFGRHMPEKERKEMVAAVVRGIKEAQAALLNLTDGWHKQHEDAVKRRARAQKARELLRTIMLAWREEADERGARSLAKHDGSKSGTGCLRLRTRGTPLPEAHTNMLVSHEVRHRSQVTGEMRVGKDPYDERVTFATKGECASLKERRGKRESAVPAGSHARLFLTWMRLTGGPAFLRDRRDKRDWEGRPPGKHTLRETERDRGKAGLSTDEDRKWTGAGIGSRANTDKYQHTEQARRLFAEANAASHERGERVRRGQKAPPERKYRHRPTPRAHTRAQGGTQEGEATEASDSGGGDNPPGTPGGSTDLEGTLMTPPGDAAEGGTPRLEKEGPRGYDPLSQGGIECMECADEEEYEEDREYEGHTEEDQNWEWEMEMQTEMENEAAAQVREADTAGNASEGGATGEGGSGAGETPRATRPT